MPTDELEDVVDYAPGPVERLAARERDAAVRGALGKLGDRCRLLLRLLASDPRPSYEEISGALDMPIGSIGPTRARCLVRLRDEMQLVGITDAR